MPPPESTAESSVEKVLRMIDYLTRVALLKTKVNRDLAGYEEVVWLSSVPSDKHCFTQASGRSEEHETDVWLEVKAGKEPGLPEVPGVCKEWIDPETLTDTSKPPQLGAETTLEIPNPACPEDSGQPKRSLRMRSSLTTRKCKRLGLNIWNRIGVHGPTSTTRGKRCMTFTPRSSRSTRNSCGLVRNTSLSSDLGCSVG